MSDPPDSSITLLIGDGRRGEPQITGSPNLPLAFISAQSAWCVFLHSGDAPP